MAIARAVCEKAGDNHEDVGLGLAASSGRCAAPLPSEQASRDGDTSCPTRRISMVLEDRQNMPGFSPLNNSYGGG
jgi:hypothetical protein